VRGVLRLVKEKITPARATDAIEIELSSGRRWGMIGQADSLADSLPPLDNGENSGTIGGKMCAVSGPFTRQLGFFIGTAPFSLSAPSGGADSWGRLAPCHGSKHGSIHSLSLDRTSLVR